MTIERLTKITVRSVWPEKSPSPQGIPEFTPADIALGVAYCNPIGGAILLHKYVFNQVTRQQCPEFYRDVWGLAIRTAIQRGWDEGAPGEAWYRKIAHAALYEVLSPALNCPQCKGAKFIGQRACPGCGATGRTHIDSDDRGEAIGIPPSAWDHGRPPWKIRHEVIYRRLTELESLAGRQLNWALSDYGMDDRCAVSDRS